VNVTVGEFQGGIGKNMSLTSQKVCKEFGSNGSVACRIPMLNETFDLSLLLDLNLEIEEGSIINATLTPQMGGLFGPLVEQILLPITLTMPLCGENTAVEIFGEVVQVETPTCGNYSLGFRNKVPASLSGTDLANMDLPEVPDMGMDLTIDDLLPAGATLDLTLLKKDGSTMAHFSVYAGLGTL